MIARLSGALFFLVPAVAQADYIRVPPRPAAAPQGAKIVFINRCEGGLTAKSAWVDDANKNKSSILEADAVLPEYAFGDESWSEVMRHVRELFAPFDIIVTDVDPAPEIHYEAVVCGKGINAGYRNTWGVAPYACEFYPNSLSFTFPETIGNNPPVIADTLAQEVAHTFGLDHLLDCRDPMTYLDDCGPKSFQDRDLECGEYSPRECDCGGATQNPYRYIIDAFGPQGDEEGPQVAIVSPADGEVVAPGADLEIAIDLGDDTAGIAAVALYANGELASELVWAPWGPWPVRGIPEGTYEFYVIATDGLGNESMSEPVIVHAMVEPDEPDDPTEDEDEDEDTDTPDTGGDGADGDAPDDAGCGCGAGGGTASPPALLLLLLVATRRTRAGVRSRG